jgi:hypothetical protein
MLSKSFTDVLLVARGKTESFDDIKYLLLLFGIIWGVYIYNKNYKTKKLFYRELIWVMQVLAVFFFITQIYAMIYLKFTIQTYIEILYIAFAIIYAYIILFKAS